MESVRKEINMIINENNKNQVLQGMVKRGFNQTPKELRSKLHPTDIKINEENNIKAKPSDQNNKINIGNGELRNTITKMNRLK